VRNTRSRPRAASRSSRLMLKLSTSRPPPDFGVGTARRSSCGKRSTGPSPVRDSSSRKKMSGEGRRENRAEPYSRSAHTGARATSRRSRSLAHEEDASNSGRRGDGLLSSNRGLAVDVGGLGGGNASVERRAQTVRFSYPASGIAFGTDDLTVSTLARARDANSEQV